MDSRAKIYARTAWDLVRQRGATPQDLALKAIFNKLNKITPAVVAKSRDYEFLVSTHDRAVGLSTFVQGPYDLDIVRRSLDIVAEHTGSDPVAGKVFIDVGANIGTTSIPAAVSWGASRVIAIEPSPDNVRLLKCNTILNACDHLVSVVPAAITTQREQVRLALSEENSGDNRIVMEMGVNVDHFGESEWPAINVPAMTLDELVTSQGIRHEEVGLIWIDTQGHELHVLRSARALLESKVPVVAEYWPYGLSRASEVDDFNEFVANNFSAVLDVRSGLTLTVDDLALLQHRYIGPSEYTDLVLLP